MWFFAVGDVLGQEGEATLLPSHVWSVVAFRLACAVSYYNIVCVSQLICFFLIFWHTDPISIKKCNACVTAKLVVLAVFIMNTFSRAIVLNLEYIYFFSHCMLVTVVIPIIILGFVNCFVVAMIFV